MANNSVVTQEAFLDFYADNIRPYLNGATHAGFTPVGTVISYFGETAPEYFLVCDGTEYAKSDYPQLADLLLNLTDPTPYIGSDSDHFKVPDLRGEFIRGTGTNSHTNGGNGSNVGIHQDGTFLPETIAAYSQIYYCRTSTNPNVEARAVNIDRQIGAHSPQQYKFTSPTIQDSDAGVGQFATRPTNTSVLYCIKY